MTATETATIEAETPSETINDLVHEAMLSYEHALKTGIQLQEDSVKLWRDLLARGDSRQELRKSLDSLSTGVYPNLRKHLEEFIESSSLSLMLVNRSGSQMLDLASKVLGIYRSTSIAAGQQCLRELLDGSLAAMRDNVPAFVTANAKIISSLKGLADLNPIMEGGANAQTSPPGRAA